MPSVSRGTTGPATDISGGERGKLGEGGEAVSVSGQGKHIVLMSVSRVRSGNFWPTLYYRPLHVSYDNIQHVLYTFSGKKGLTIFWP